VRWRLWRLGGRGRVLVVEDKAVSVVVSARYVLAVCVFVWLVSSACECCGERWLSSSAVLPGGATAWRLS
jgi:hypothetical protein